MWLWLKRSLIFVFDRSGVSIAISEYDVDRNQDTFAISMVDCSSQGIFLLKVSIVEYEHIVLVDNITKFNDLVYNPLIGLRQPRLRAFIQKTEPWVGKPTARGFIIRDDDLIDNIETSVTDIENYFSTEDLEDTSIQKQVAKHFIGYQDREYLDNLLLSKKSQFEFYQGFIREKGTPSSFKKLLRNDFVTKSADYSIAEEWAFLLGEYGNIESRSSLQLKLLQSDLKTNPQTVLFTTEPTDSKQDNIISITP